MACDPKSVKTKMRDKLMAYAKASAKKGKGKK